MSELRDLYQEVILDHNKHPHNFGELTGADRHADGFNPLCGDKLVVYVNLDGDMITDVRFKGSGCAISKASASLMTDSVKGKTLVETRELFDQFLNLVTDGDVADDDEVLGKLAVFAGVRDYPTRVKCASLAWHTLRAAVEDRHDVVTTE
jgi:nitrogen fixation NifU-like protein